MPLKHSEKDGSYLWNLGNTYHHTSASGYAFRKALKAAVYGSILELPRNIFQVLWSLWYPHNVA